MKKKLISSRDDSRGKKVAATVTIIRGGEMTVRGRKQIAGWLRRQANFLERNGERMTEGFTARWTYGDKLKGR